MLLRGRQHIAGARGPLGIKSLGTFRPAFEHGCVQTGDVDPASVGDEIVVSTFAGRVVWFKRSDLLGPIDHDADLTGDGLDEVIFAPLYSPISHMGGTVRAHVHVLTGSSGTFQELPGTTGVPVGEANNDDFLGYGACGLAVADLPTDPVISKAIFVTTMNGELVVYKQTNGVIDPTALYRKVVAGSLGAFNSIVIENLVPDASSKPEVYIAGSSGIVRFDFP